MKLRTRLTLWYAGVVILILTAAGAAMIVAHTRLGMHRLDAELEGLCGAITTILDNEIDERQDLVAAAHDATEEIGISGRAIVILSANGQPLASRDDRLSSSVLAHVPSGTGLTTLSTSDGDVRVVSAAGSHAGLDYIVRVAASLRLLEEERRTLTEVVGIGLALALLVAGLGGWVIGRQALQPIAAMADEAGTITATGNVTRLTVPRSDDDLEHLGTAFNGVLGRLASAMAVQREFMADASHELRTPVSVARTTAQVTLDRDHRSEFEYRESLTIVAEQAERLTRMVDDMFLLARADAQARPLRPSPMYMDELIDECVRAVRVLARRSGVSIASNGAKDVAFVGDEDLLRQMLLNVLENGVAHSPSGGSVTITLRHTPAQVEIAIDDSGPGVPAADRERVFNRFVRLAPSSARVGAGLGLPIARWVAEQHGGSLTLESSAPASARFIIRLPGNRG